MAGPALEVITGSKTNPGAALVPLLPNSGDSFQIKSTPEDVGPLLLGIWASSATAGSIRVRSPRMHDNVQGIKFQVPAGLQRNFMPDEGSTPMFSQDLLTFEIAGGAAEVDAGALLIYYPQLGGSDARYATWDQVKAQMVEMVTVEVAVAGPVAAGDWSPGTAINSTSDLLKANADYAVLGYQTGTSVCAVAVKGPDTGNYRAGGPGPTESVETRDWFASLSRLQGKPLIPVINQANRGATLVHVCHTAAAGTINVDLILARLAGRFG